MLSYNSYDCLSLQPIPVIASFDSDGKLCPLYIGLNGSRLKVESYYVRCELPSQIEFHCTVIVEDCRKPIVITYHIRDHKWTTPKV